jgi:hypothetical protein
MAKDKWSDSTDSLQSFVPENKDKEVFVPLSSSLYEISFIFSIGIDFDAFNCY